jgi:hypothetical protein
MDAVERIRGSGGGSVLERIPNFFFTAGVTRGPFLVSTGQFAGGSTYAYASGSVAAPARTNLEQDSEDDEDYQISLFRSLHPSLTGNHSRYIAASAPNAGRSYASNMNDRTAGNGAENPLEIEDDSDGEVEVVEVD